MNGSTNSPRLTLADRVALGHRLITVEGESVVNAEPYQLVFDLDSSSQPWTPRCEEIHARRLDALDALGVAVPDRDNYGAVRRLHLGATR